MARRAFRLDAMAKERECREKLLLRAWRSVCDSTLAARIRTETTVLAWPQEGLLNADGRLFKQLLGMPVTEAHYSKQGRSVGRCVIDTPSGRRTVYLKRYGRAASLLQAGLAVMAPTCAAYPALSEWRGHDRASQWGIPVPRVVASGEQIGPWFRRRSLIAVCELEGMLPLHLAIPEAARMKSVAAFRVWKRSLAREMARLVQIIHRRRHYHKDLYLSHFFCCSENLLAPRVQPGCLYLIDMHRLTRHPWSGWRWRVQDLAQLLFSSEMPEIDRRDRLCFYSSYLRGTKIWRMPLRTAVCLQAWHFRNHNRRRRGPSL